ncbi:TVP38/TMEM64 family protein [Virgibacillus kekensis]|uniref:TVP38/TMEM64 family membrane protein n=1 Tax=Virgibacillus kekensis TaxID=202261 RepID=A0ABV9DKZ4_9BACI
MNKQLKSFIWKLAALLSVAGLLILLNKVYFHITPKQIEMWINGLGFWAPVIILLVFTIRPFTLVPLSIFAIATGMIFGQYMGTLYIVIGTVLGATASFIVMKKFFKDAKIEDDSKETLRQLKKDLESHGFKSVLMLRVAPVLNFDLVTFVCSKTDVYLWKYIAGTALGTLPGSFMFGFFGSSLLKLNPVNLIILTVIIIVIAGLSYVMYKQLGKKYNLLKLQEEIKELKNGN